MRPLVLSSTLLLAWSVVSDLVIGETFYTLRNLLLTIVMVTAWWSWRGRHWGRTAVDLGLEPAKLARGLVYGVMAFCLVSAALVAGVALAPRVPMIAAFLQDERAAMFADRLWWVALIRIPIGTAVFEEVAFRGVLLAAARDALNLRAAVTWTSVVFGFWHVPPTMVALWMNDLAVTDPAGFGTLIAAVVVTTVAGALFTWLRLASGSLLAPIIAHIATNSLALLAAVRVQQVMLQPVP